MQDGKKLQTQSKSPPESDLDRKSLKLCPVCNSDMTNYHGNAKTCSRECKKILKNRSEIQRLREAKRKKRLESWERYKKTNPLIIKLAKNILNDFKDLFGERHVYVDYLRGVLRQFHDVKMSNDNYCMLIKEIKKDNKHRWAFR